MIYSIPGMYDVTAAGRLKNQPPLVIWFIITQLQGVTVATKKMIMTLVLLGLDIYQSMTRYLFPWLDICGGSSFSVLNV